MKDIWDRIKEEYKGRIKFFSENGTKFVICVRDNHVLVPGKNGYKCSIGECVGIIKMKDIEDGLVGRIRKEFPMNIRGREATYSPIYDSLYEGGYVPLDCVYVEI